MQARKRALILAGSVALLIGCTGWLIVGRWAYHRYRAQAPVSSTPANSALPPGPDRAFPAELLAQAAAVSNKSFILLSPFAEAETQRWLSIPKGLFETNSVTFFCDGAIRLNGLTRARGKQSEAPGAILDIPVNLKGNRLNWLHASENSGGTPPGASYATIVLHYEDGSTQRFDLRYNVHGRDWFGSKRFADLPLRDPNSSVVWAKQRRDGSHIGLYHTVMSNPAPDLTIISMDVISPLNPANVLLVGAAVTSSDRPLQPSPIPQTPEPSRCLIDFVIKESGSASAQPASTKPDNATLQFTLLGPSLTVEYPAFHADSAGTVAIDVPLGPLSEIRYHATGANGATAEGTLAKDENGLFPASHSVILRKANMPAPAVVEKSN